MSRSKVIQTGKNAIVEYLDCRLPRPRSQRSYGQTDMDRSTRLAGQTDMARLTRLVYIYFMGSETLPLPVTYFPTNLVYTFTLRVTGINTKFHSTSNGYNKEERYSQVPRISRYPLLKGKWRYAQQSEIKMPPPTGGIQI